MTYCLTCDYQACQKIKVKDLFAGLNLSDITCQSKIARINRILRNFYLDTIDFEQNRVSQVVTCIGDTTINTEFPVYKLRGFYAEVDPSQAGCIAKHCITNSTMDEICLSCGTDPQKTFLLQTFQTKGNRAQGQYTMSCDNVIHFHAYDCFPEIYVEYSRGPLTITSLEDEISIDSKMLIALEYYIEWHYALRDKQLNLKNTYAELYADVLSKLKDSESFIPISIGSSYGSAITSL